MNVAQTLRALPTETEMKARVCNQCLLTEDHPEFETRCPGTKTGKHRLRPRVLWAGSFYRPPSISVPKQPRLAIWTKDVGTQTSTP